MTRQSIIGGQLYVGPKGASIKSIVKIEELSDDNQTTYDVLLDNGESAGTFSVINGVIGHDGSVAAVKLRNDNTKDGFKEHHVITSMELNQENKEIYYDYDNIRYNNTMPCTEAIGGIAKNTTFNNMPVQELLTKMLYKYYAPTITAASISSSTNNNYYGGSTTVKSITVTFDRGTTQATFKSLKATFDGVTYTATDPKFTSKTYSYTFDINPDKIFTGTSSVNHIIRTATITGILNQAGENGEEKTLTTSRNIDVWFNRSDAYYGSSLVNNSKDGFSTLSNISSWGGDRRLVFSCNQNFPTIITPAKWGNNITVKDGAQNPVTGVFSKVNTITLTNKNNFSESYNVFQSNTKASGSVAYLIKIS